MAVESITLSTSANPKSVTITREQMASRGRVEKATGDLLSLVRERQAGKVAETGELVVPEDEDFEDLDWYDGGEIAGVAVKLIEKHPATFRAASRSSLDFAWKRKGGATGGKQTYGMCNKVGGLVKVYRPELEFVIWLAADNIRDAMLTPYQIEAIIFRELKHVGRTDKNKPCIIAHDATVFVDEVTEYGMWMRDIQTLGGAFQQLRLDTE